MVRGLKKIKLEHVWKPAFEPRMPIFERDASRRPRNIRDILRPRRSVVAENRRPQSRNGVSRHALTHISMITQELLIYIKQQLEQGVSREQIKSVLIASGWYEQDVEEGFYALESSASSPTNYANAPTSSPSKVAGIVVVSIVGVLLLGGGIYGAYFAYQRFFVPAERPGETPVEAERPALDLRIVVPKETYRVGERFDGGEYTITYEGEEFMAVTLEKKTRSGFGNYFDSSSIGTLGGDFGVSTPLHAFRLNATEPGVSKDYFPEPGEYTFTISVFRCSDLGLTDDDCTFEATPTEFLLGFQPIATASKTIVVTNGTPAASPAPATRPAQRQEAPRETPP